MDIPDSLCEVVLSFCLLVVTHTGLRQLVSILADELDLPEPPKAERGPDRVADDDGPDGTRYRFCSHTIGFACHCDANDLHKLGTACLVHGDASLVHGDASIVRCSCDLDFVQHLCMSQRDS